MNKILESFEDQNARGVYIYINGINDTMWADPEYTIPIKRSDLIDAFLKGCVIVLPNGFITKPIRLKDNSSESIASVYWVNVASDGTTLKLIEQQSFPDVIE